jgi:hypothetical protein
LLTNSKGSSASKVRASSASKGNSGSQKLIGEGHVILPQDVNEAANRLNLLCGSIAAGNDNIQLKNEISAICDHLYKQKVLSKPELKKIVKKYCF